MILNISGRTDIVNYYTPWLLNRFKEGYVLSRNPLFPQKILRYDLSPDKVDALVFCSKNYKPILPYLSEITAKYPTYFFYTITAYGRDIEPNVPHIEDSVKTLLELEKIVGKNRIAWRYDPVLLTDRYTVQTHRKTFAYLCDALTSHVDRCIFSFVEIYRKLETNLPELRMMSNEEKLELAYSLGRIANVHGIPIQTCGTDEDFSRFGIRPSGCIALDVLGKANGIAFRKHKPEGTRKGCHCVATRDIGAYDTCPNGCHYCYANQNSALARKNFLKHDRESPLLFGKVEEGDIIIAANQKSLLLP